MKKVYIYAKYERFWHWTQAGLILLLALTGFEVHGSYQVMGYEAATVIHINAAWALIGLTLLTWFWGFVTGEWKQFNPFVPSMRFMKQQIQYYMGGIFKGEEHPTHKTKYTKFNPLQRVTYLGLVVVIIPFMLFSGLAYLFHDAWGITNFEMLANAHVLGAFLLLAFVIGHIYLTTTGYKPLCSGGTPLYESIINASNSAIAEKNSHPNNKVIIVLYTDGIANNAYNKQNAIDAISKVKHPEIDEIYLVFVNTGDISGKQILEDVATKANRHFIYLQSAEQLASELQKVLQ